VDPLRTPARESGFDLASLPLGANYKSLLDDNFMPVVTLDGMNGSSPPGVRPIS